MNDFIRASGEFFTFKQMGMWVDRFGFNWGLGLEKYDY